MKTHSLLIQSEKKHLNTRSVIFLMVGIFIALQVFYTLQTVTSGARLSELEHEIAKLTLENKVLTESILGKSSLTKIEESVEAEGYTKNHQVVYVKEDTFAVRLQ